MTKALSAAALLGGALVLAVPPTAVSAALPPPAPFVFTGGEQTYQVPAGVAVVLVHATGGFGGPAFNQGGGQGEDLTAYLPVTPNQNLYTEVGQNGSAGGGVGFGGGAAGGAQSYVPPVNYNVASSGGGATDVRTCSEVASSCPGGGTSDASRLIVAGGGGGSGGDSLSQFDACGGDGGAGGANGTGRATTSAGTFVLGIDGTAGTSSTPSRGGTEQAPGAGGVTASCVFINGNGYTYSGSVAGNAGSGRSGGSGGNAPAFAGGGGGGGGGYFGGGGGASGNEICSPSSCLGGSGGAGGAGGSSFVTSAALVSSFGGGQSVPQVTYTPEITIDSPANGATYTRGQVVDASFACDSAVFSLCTGTVASGQPVDTSTVGSHSFVVTGTIGTHTVSGTVTYTVAGARPGAPTMGAPSVGNGSVTLNWTAPASDGGSSVLGYNVYEGTSSGGESATAVNGNTLLPANAVGDVITGLLNGTQYFFTVTAVNAAGESGPSGEASATPSTVPAAPSAPVAATNTKSAVGLTWTDSNNGGSAVTGHQVKVFTFKAATKHSPATYLLVTTVTTGSTAQSYTVTGLSAKKNYAFTVAAGNVNGFGAFSAFSNVVAG